MLYPYLGFVYISIIVFIVGTLYRVVKWFREPLQLRWEIYPVPHHHGGKIGELKEVLKEMIFIVRVWRGRRELWLFTWIFHIGLYLAILFLALVVIGGIVELVGIPVSITTKNSLGLTIAGLTLLVLSIAPPALIFGSFSLFIIRVIDRGMRMYSAPIDYMNMLLPGIIVLPALITNIYAYIGLLGGNLILLDNVAQAFRNEVIALLTGNATLLTEILSDPGLAITNTLMLLFLIYWPFSKMIHFLGKYFTYHKVLWDDKAGLEGWITAKYWGIASTKEIFEKGGQV